MNNEGWKMDLCIDRAEGFCFHSLCCRIQLKWHFLFSRRMGRTEIPALGYES